MVLINVRLRPEQDCAGESQQQQQITDPSFRQRGRYKIINQQLSKENIKEEEKLVAGPRWVPDTKTDGRLTVGRKITFTLTFLLNPAA
jgi:hypothetical protein